MALCEYCQAELEGRGAPLPPHLRGPVWVIAGEERRPRPMLRRIFRVLYQRRQGPVHRDSLITLLTGTRNEPMSENCLRVSISHLRGLLLGSEYGVINYFDTGYQLVAAELAANSPPLRAWSGDRRAVNRLRRAARLQLRGLALLLASAPPRR